MNMLPIIGRPLLKVLVITLFLVIRKLNVNGQPALDGQCSRLRIHSDRWFRRGYTYLESIEKIDAPTCVGNCCQRNDCDGVMYMDLEKKICYLLSCNSGGCELSNQTQMYGSGFVNVQALRATPGDVSAPALTAADIARLLRDATTAAARTTTTPAGAVTPEGGDGGGQTTEVGRGRQTPDTDGGVGGDIITTPATGTDNDTDASNTTSATTQSNPDTVFVIGGLMWPPWVVGPAIIGCVVMTACCLGLLAATAVAALRRRRSRSEKLTTSNGARPMVSSPGAWVTDATPVNGTQGALRAYSNDVNVET